MKHGTLVAALIVFPTPVFRASASKPIQPAPSAPLKNGVMMESSNSFLRVSSRFRERAPPEHFDAVDCFAMQV